MRSDDLFRVDSPVGTLFYFRNDRWFTGGGPNQIFEQDIVLKYLKKIIQSSKLALDIGAHVGSHSIIYSNLNFDLKILAFEPQKKIFELLKYNIDFSNLENVHPYNLAVGNTSGTTTLDSIVHEPGHDILLSYDINLPANFGGVGLGPGGERVQMVSIDDLELERCDYIKIDVEGAENLVILGGRKTILKYKPSIFFESNHTHMTPQTLNSLGIDRALPNAKEMLQEFGYSQILKIDDNNYLASYKRDFGFETMLIRFFALKRKLKVRQRIRQIFTR
jgi:FkbM family methyltransferase